MSTQLRNLYREAADFLTYLKLYAPDFPTRDEMTCEKALSRLFDYLVGIEGAERNVAANRWLRIYREELKKAERLFGSGRHSDGRKTLDSAKDYLNKAATK